MLIKNFKMNFHTIPSAFIIAPGRVNLIGDHTDYNEGFALPMTIHLSLMMAICPRADDSVQIYSCHFKSKKTFRLNSWVAEPQDDWMRYVKGMAYVLQQEGYPLKGFNAVIAGNIPQGAGLSSSAALELLIAYGFSWSSGFPWNPKGMAKLAQRAENEWVGMRCGVMDQMAITHGQKGCALLLDCRSLTMQSVPISPDIAIVLMDTGTRRGLVDSQYNDRRMQCEEATRILHVKALRDVTRAEWDAVEKRLPDSCRAKAKHVIFENDRVLQAVKAMAREDKKQLGRLFYESHCSMRDDFQISSRPLDAMVECAMMDSACYGARMTGGGFAGCAVAVVKADQAKLFCQRVSEAYQKQTQLKPNLYVTRAVDGVHVENGLC